MTRNLHEITLPALRGVMGDWVYYSCLMDLGELSSRVHYAEEIHKSKALSDMIQRQLTKDRSTQIAEYLKIQPERFFNFLVIATYGGQPNWYALSNVRSTTRIDEITNLSKDTISSVGFLTLRGDENLFALDGQHRLAGIKRAVQDGLENDPYDEVSVIFVAHQNTNNGLERTRRLFATLNKTARPVSKGDIIALDEDDVMAICVRRLIEESDLFSDDRIAFVASNNVSSSNTISLTTIGNLYDILTILFRDSNFPLRKKGPVLQRVRPSQNDLDQYFDYSNQFFLQLRRFFKELDEFFSAQNTESVVKKYRGEHGGSVLFRPIGLKIFTRIVSKLTQDISLMDAVEQAAKLPTNLSLPPYRGLMWNTSTRTISNSHNPTLREILLYMLGSSKKSKEYLVSKYREIIEDNTINLPVL